MKQNTENTLGVHSMCYNGTNFFNGFSATTIDFNKQTAPGKHLIFFPCEQLIITDTSDPDNWTAVSATNPERYGVVPRRLLRITELRQEPWFYPELPQSTIIPLLKRQGPGSFLVRTHKKKHLISHMSERNVHHTWIHQSESGRYYINSRRRFSTIQELLDYSKRNQVDGMKLDKFPSQRSVEEYWKMDFSKVDLRMHRDVTSPFPWHIRMGKTSDGQDASVMYLKKNSSKDDEYWLKKQARILMCLQHENIVQLMGIGDISSRFTVMLQIGGNENLMDYIKSCPSDNPQMPYEHLDIATQICTALAHLEKRGIVHNELMAENCWLHRPSMKLKLGGFHLARFEDDLQEVPTKYKSKVLILPPEISDGQTPSSMSDVWAYGIFLWVLFTRGRHVQHGIKLSKIVNYQWKDLPADVGDIVDQMMNACLYQIPQIRPTFCDILRQLRTWLVGPEHNEQGSMPSKGFDLFELETYEQRVSDATPFTEVSPSSVEENRRTGARDPYDTELSTTFEENVDFAFQEKYTLQAMNFERRDSITSRHSCNSPDQDSFDLQSPTPDDSYPDLYQPARLNFDESLAVNIDEADQGVDLPNTFCSRFETPQTETASFRHAQCLSSDSGVSVHHLSRVDHMTKQELDKFFNLAKKYKHLYRQEKAEREDLEEKVREFETSCKDKLDVMIVKLSDKIKELELHLDTSQAECKKFKERNRMLARSFCDRCRARMNTGSRNITPQSSCDKVIQTDVSYSEESFVLDVDVPDDGTLHLPSSVLSSTMLSGLSVSEDSFAISALSSAEELSPLRPEPWTRNPTQGRKCVKTFDSVTDSFDVTIPEEDSMSLESSSSTSSNSQYGTIKRCPGLPSAKTGTSRTTEGAYVEMNSVNTQNRTESLNSEKSNGTNTDISQEQFDPIKQAIQNMAKENEAHKMKLRQLERESRRSRELLNSTLTDENTQNQDSNRANFDNSKGNQVDSSFESVRSFEGCARPVPDFSHSGSSRGSDPPASAQNGIGESDCESDSGNIGDQSAISGVFPLDGFTDNTRENAFANGCDSSPNNSGMSYSDSEECSAKSSEENLLAAQRLVQDNLMHKYLSNKTHISTFVPNGSGFSKVTLL